MEFSVFRRKSNVTFSVMLQSDFILLFSIEGSTNLLGIKLWSPLSSSQVIR